MFKTMLKQQRIVFDSIFYPLFALGLGYAFSALLLKGFIPDSWATPGAFLSAVGFFFALRWMRTEAVPQAERSPTEVFHFARRANARRRKNLWAGLYRNNGKKHFKSTLASATTSAAMKFKECGRHNARCYPKGKAA